MLQFKISPSQIRRLGLTKFQHLQASYKQLWESILAVVLVPYSATSFFFTTEGTTTENTQNRHNYDIDSEI